MGDSGKLVESCDNPNISIRGLESRTDYATKIKKQKRLSAYAAVFNCQKELGFIDENAIADAYYLYTKHCLVAAQIIAKRDEIEANNAWDTSKMEFLMFKFRKTVSSRF